MNDSKELRSETVRPELELIASGTHFWCETHLSAIPVEKSSPDRRYCQDCYLFLVGEAKILLQRGATKRPAWIPNPLPKIFKPFFKGINKDQKPVTTYLTLSGNGTGNVTALGPTRTAAKDGKKAAPQLDKAIEQMANQGMSSRAIAVQLGLDGLKVSHMTVTRHIRKTKVTPGV